MDLEFAITTVKYVKWNASKHGKLKPTVYIEPVHLNGHKNLRLLVIMRILLRHTK